MDLSPKTMVFGEKEIGIMLTFLLWVELSWHERERIMYGWVKVQCA